MTTPPAANADLTHQPGFRCPSCGAPYVEKDGNCSACGAASPWKASIESVKEQLKERDINRARTTFTLIEEAVQHARGGPPISLAALKGFVASWIFPRATIVLGSLIAGAVLVVQTVILWFQTGVMEAQTELLGTQTEAMRTEQADRLRLRLAETELLRSKLQPFVIDSAREPKPPLDECPAQCERTKLSADMPDDAIIRKHLMSAVGYATKLASTMVPPADMNADGLARKQIELSDLLAQAQRQCLVPAATATKTTLAFQCLSLLVETGDVDWSQRPIYEEGRQYPSEAEIKADFSHWYFRASDASRVCRPAIVDLTAGNVRTAVKSSIADLVDALNEIATACAQQSTADRTALEQIAAEERSRAR